MFGNFVLLVLWVLTSAQFCTLDIQGTPDLTGAQFRTPDTTVLTGAQFRVLRSLQGLNFGYSGPYRSSISYLGNSRNSGPY